MNNRRKSNRRMKTNQKKVVIRCKNKMIPVFDRDLCEDFAQNDKSNSDNNCKNCKHSF
jgi:hypothetical protein